MRSFTYEFEELPLAIVDGIPAVFTNGCADIAYSRDGRWGVMSIGVEGHRDISREERAAGKRPWVYVTAPATLCCIIVDRLESEWRYKVSSAVSDRLEKDREYEADDRASTIRNRRVEAA